MKNKLTIIFILITFSLVTYLIKLKWDNRKPNKIMKWIIVILLYLVSPIDLIPDVAPPFPIGFIDDLIVIIIGINLLLKRADRINNSLGGGGGKNYHKQQSELNKSNIEDEIKIRKF